MQNLFLRDVTELGAFDGAAPGLAGPHAIESVEACRIPRMNLCPFVPVQTIDLDWIGHDGSRFRPPGPSLKHPPSETQFSTSGNSYADGRSCGKHVRSIAALLNSLPTRHILTRSCGCCACALVGAFSAYFLGNIGQHGTPSSICYVAFCCSIRPRSPRMPARIGPTTTSASSGLRRPKMGQGSPVWGANRDQIGYAARTGSALQALTSPMAAVLRHVNLLRGRSIFPHHSARELIFSSYRFYEAIEQSSACFCAG